MLRKGLEMRLGLAAALEFHFVPLKTPVRIRAVVWMMLL